MFPPEGLLGNLSYLIENKEKKEAFVVDPSSGEKIYSFLKEKNILLLGIINTHEHADHISGNFYLCSQIKNLSVFSVVEDFFKYYVSGKDSITSISTPGHTANDRSILVNSGDIEVGLICGDTLFHGGVGNCRSGDSKTLYRSTQKILKLLNHKTPLFFGHDYMETNLRFVLRLDPHNKKIEQLIKEKKENLKKVFPTNLEEEIQYNPFFRTSVLGKDSESEQERFIILRKMRDSWV